MRVNELRQRICAGLLVATSTMIGCGSVQAEFHVAYSVEPEQIAPKEAQSVEIPDATARQLKVCVDAGAGRWSPPSHALQYNVSANENGKVLTAKLHDATLHDSTLEACFSRALLAMHVPEEALRMRVSKPFSGGENMSYSRSSLGVVQAAAPIALAPIIIPALGVVIIVAISIEIVRNATSGPDCKQIKQECITFCSETTLPTPDFGWKFQKCKNDCLESQGCPRNS